VSGRRGWIPWVLLGVVAIAVIAWAAWPSGARTDAERARSLAKELRCPDCESLSAADSQTASARAIRRDLKERIAEGQSDETIRAAYVDRYGESILLEPDRSGFGLIVWGLPVLIVVGGAVGLGLAFRRWRGIAPMHATEADEELVREVRREGTDA
jgi:cytochrome c-type biogenesis protein CcmH